MASVKEIIQEIANFTDFQPKEETDIISYLYTARELANYYDIVISQDSNATNSVARVRNIMKRCAPYVFSTYKKG